MAWPPAALPTNRSNTSAKLNTHAADHNAANAAINDTVTRLRVIERNIYAFRTVALFDVNGLWYGSWAGLGVTWGGTPAVEASVLQTTTLGNAGVNVQTYQPHNNAIDLVLQANYVKDGVMFQGNIDIHIFAYGTRTN